MEVIAIGDLHIETGQPWDDFGLSGGAADKALIQLTEDYPDARFIFSEAFECQQSLRHERRKEQVMSAIWHAHSDALEALWSRTEAWIVGNHDARLLGMKWHGLECLPHLVWNGVWFEHGHAHDSLISRWPEWCARVAEGVGHCERLFGRNFDIWASRTWAWLSGTGRHGANTAYQIPVWREAEAHGCHTALYGHTHLHARPAPCYTHDMSKMIVTGNTGHWTNGSRDVTRLEV